MAKDPGRILIFDTTLRDGEQSPGASMTAEEKMHIARQLERMPVDVIEAGCPAASTGDLAAGKAIATEIKTSTICFEPKFYLASICISYHIKENY